MDLIRHNPFRTLGLPVTATEREIAKQVNTLATYAEMGKAKTFETDFPFFPAVDRSPEAIEEAKKKIEQPENKMFNSLFWFWKNNTADELAFELLKEGNTDKAIEVWEKAVFSNKQVIYKEAVIHENLIASSTEWSTEKDADHRLEKMGGNYVIERIKETSTSIPVVVAQLTNAVPNWSIEVDTTWASGPDNVGYGIIFGRNKGDYFSFDLAADGHYSFNKYVNWVYEKRITWATSEAINPHGENHLQIKKIGDTFHFYINRKLVDTFAAEPLFGDNFGFKVSHNQKVIFRNFRFAQLVVDDKYGVGIPVSTQNVSNVKNLSTLFLGGVIINDVFNQAALYKGVELAGNFFQAQDVYEYARMISGEKYVYSSEKALTYYINELTESLRPVLDKPGGISLGQFIGLFESYPPEAKQYLVARYMSGPMQNVEKAIEQCAIVRKNNPEKAAAEGLALIEKTKGDIEFLKNCASPEDVQYQITADKLSGEIVQCGIDYFNKMKDDQPCLPLYQYALSIAGSIRAREKAKENLDSCIEWMQNSHLRNCWFCGKVPPSEAHKHSHTIYRVNSRGYRSVQYSYVPIDIARCESCANVHSKASTKLWVSILGITVLGFMLGYMIDEQILIGSIAGLGIGIAVGLSLKSADLNNAGIKSTSVSTLKTYPLIKKMLDEGWQMHKPSA